MASVAVKGGERAIDNAQTLLAETRRGDPAVAELSLAQIAQQLGLAVDRVEIVDLAGDATPPTLEVRVRWRGAWYREDRDTQGVVEGSRDRPVRRTEAWTLALTDDRATPWRLVAAD